MTDGGVNNLSLNSGDCLDDVVIQSPNDKRDYRVIVLENGLRALLISDMGADPESSSSANSDQLCQPSNPKTPHTKTAKMAEPASDDSDATEDDSDISEMEEDVLNSPSATSKKQVDEDAEKLAAAALCIGVGSFCDPPEIPGLAHFLEHMVFMGSGKYPDENAFDSFVKKHAGNSNAFTDCERKHSVAMCVSKLQESENTGQTVFYYDIERNHFREALDIFAQFFISPLMKQNSVDREIKAVDSEYDMSKTSDSARTQQLLASLAKKNAPMGKFMWGNVASLRETPASKGIDLYDNLEKFHKKYYSSHFMTLCVQAKETLDTLQSWVTEIFSPVPNNGNTRPTFDHITDSFDTPAFTKLYQVVPVKDKHRVEITWHLPSVEHLYRHKPLQYLGWLSGHEGTGSILSYLRARLWALSIVSGNSDSGTDHNSTGALFTVNITLTDDGLTHVNEVIKVVFEYFAMLRESGASREVYNEIKVIEDNEFRWKDKIEPSDYVERLCAAMQMYDPVDYLRGDTVLYPWDSQCSTAIEFILSKLVPSRCNVMILSRNFDDQNHKMKEEYWYNTKYLVKDIPASLKGEVCKPRPELHLPHSNDYIATDFSLKEPNDLYTKTPKLVVNTDRSKLWYKQDKKFKVPRGHIYFNIISPVVCASAKSQAMFDLFIDALTHNLQEVAYNAYVAQLEYEFQITNTGVHIKVNGFNHKLAKLFETVVDHIDKFHVSEQLFQALKEQLKKNYYNSFIKPSKLASDIRLMILQENKWTKVHRRAFLADLKREELLSFVSEFKRLNFIEGYVHGNYTLAEALSIEACIRSRICSEILPQSMLPVERVAMLPTFKDSTVRVKSFHEGDANSCVVNYYQVGPANIQGHMTVQLLNMLMEEPCFDVLRTREQLGYSVYSDVKTTSGIVGLSITVSSQASKFSVQSVDQKIEEFLLEFRDRLENYSIEEFDSHRKSLIAVKEADDTHLEEAADRLWAEIRENTYVFNRPEKEKEALEELDLDGILSSCANILDTVEASLRKKLSVQVVGFGDAEKASTAVSNSNTVDLSLCQAVAMDCKVESNCSSASNSSTETAVTAPLAAAAGADVVFQLQHLEVRKETADQIDDQSEDRLVVINDLAKFRCGLSLYPVSKVM